MIMTVKQSRTLTREQGLYISGRSGPKFETVFYPVRRSRAEQEKAGRDYSLGNLVPLVEYSVTSAITGDWIAAHLSRRVRCSKLIDRPDEEHSEYHPRGLQSCRCYWTECRNQELKRHVRIRHVKTAWRRSQFVFGCGQGEVLGDAPDRILFV